jgi:tetratricopeptide (TPR) repeat protein
LRVWKQYLLLGSGPDTFFEAFRPYRRVEYLRATGAGVTQADAHNDVIQMAATQGVIGLAVYLWLFFIFLRMMMRADPKSRGSWGAALLALLVQNQFNFSSVTTSAWAAVFAGMFMSAYGRAGVSASEYYLDFRRHADTPIRRYLLWPVLFLALAGIWGIFRPLLADWHYKQGLAWSQSSSYAVALEHDREAVRLNGRIEIYGSEWGNAARSAGRMDEAWQAALDETRKHPADPDAWNNLGVGAMWMVQIARQDKWQEAKAAFEKAISLDPVFVDAWANLAKWNHLRGDLNEEKQMWKKVLQLDPNHEMAKQVLGV